MSFSSHARDARDPSRPLPHRLSSFRSCIQLHRWGINRGYQETLDRFSRAFGLDTPTSERLIQALDALEQERLNHATRLDAFAQLRREAKAKGLRSPDPVDVQRLLAADYFVIPELPREQAPEAT